MNARNQYLDDIKNEYFEASKQQKTTLLTEAAKRTGLCRKYLIVKLSAETDLRLRKRKKRACYYDNTILPALAEIWRIFDYPCGQRLAPLIKDELNKLRDFKEISCSDEIADKLHTISPANIDIKLRHEREVIRLNRYRHRKSNPLLYQSIPVKVNSELEHGIPGHCQVDYVEHCGSSASGQYIHTVSIVDVFSDWWEGYAIMPKSQEQTNAALETCRKHVPFIIKELHSDNDSSILNDLVQRWARAHTIAFSRSRPYKKNDNAHVEQKNRTHVRDIIGHRRYDTPKELAIINELYASLRLYKNFFQPIMRLAGKHRNCGKIHRAYEKPRTPHQRLIASAHVSASSKATLTRLYNSLNPALLKRTIDLKIKELYNAYEAKNNRFSVPKPEKTGLSMVRNYLSQRPRQEYVSVR